jgi:hypothetical protein
LAVGLKVADDRQIVLDDRARRVTRPRILAAWPAPDIDGRHRVSEHRFKTSIDVFSGTRFLRPPMTSMRRRLVLYIRIPAESIARCRVGIRPWAGLGSAA